MISSFYNIVYIAIVKCIFVGHREYCFLSILKVMNAVAKIIFYMQTNAIIQYCCVVFVTRTDEVRLRKLKGSKFWIFNTLFSFGVKIGRALSD